MSLMNPQRLVQRFKRWLRASDRDEQYLSAAADHADLERRQRLLERAIEPPVFVTFNH